MSNIFEELEYLLQQANWCGLDFIDLSEEDQKLIKIVEKELNLGKLHEEKSTILEKLRTVSQLSSDEERRLIEINDEIRGIKGE